MACHFEYKKMVVAREKGRELYGNRWSALRIRVISCVRFDQS